MDKTGKNIRSSINITKLISDSELTVQKNSRSNSVEDAPIPQELKPINFPYEEIYFANLTKIETLGQKFQFIFHFPEDDLIVDRPLKQRRTEAVEVALHELVKPDSGNTNTPYMKYFIDTLKFYWAPWVTVIRKYKQYEKISSIGISFANSPLVTEIDIEKKFSLLEITKELESEPSKSNPKIKTLLTNIVKKSNPNPGTPEKSREHFKTLTNSKISPKLTKDPLARKSLTLHKMTSPLSAIIPEEISIINFEDSSPFEPTFLDPHYLELPNSKTDINNLEKRNADRSYIFHLFSVDFNWGLGVEMSLCNRFVQPRYNEENRCFELLVEMKSLGFVLGELEPFWIEMALYDTRNRIKLSENFYVDVNSPQTLKLLESHSEPVDPLTCCKKALFTISQPHSEIWLVVIVNKVFQGDIEVIRDTYIEPNEQDSKNVKKAKSFIQDNIANICERNGAFRQQFCWTALTLFDDMGNLIQSGDVQQRNFFATTFKDQQNLLDQLQELQTNKSKKLKSIPSICVLNLAPIRNTLLAIRIDPSLNQVKLEEILPSSNSFIREVREFPLVLNQPALDYENNLYIYPESINITNYNGKGRNILVEMFIKKEDADSHLEFLNLIYGKSSCRAFTKVGATTISYHNKSPHFIDEIKIKLPVLLYSKHHLFFRFYHVTAKLKRNEDHVEVPIGYSFLPLYVNDKIVRSGIYNLPIFFSKEKGKDKGYLTNSEKSSYIDNGKSLFRVRLKLCSSLYPEDDYLQQFFQLVNENQFESAAFLQAIQNFGSIYSEVCVQYFPILMKHLLLGISKNTKKNPSIGQAIFKNMIIIILKIQHYTQGTAFLSKYIQHVFSNREGEEIYYCICMQYVSALVEQKINRIKHTFTHEELLTSSWFIFELIVKSMILYLDENSMLRDQIKRQERFGEATIRLLKHTNKVFTQYVILQSQVSQALDALHSLALFIRDLFHVIDRGHAIDMVFSFVEEINNSQVSQDILCHFLFDFLKIIFDFEHLIPLNLPLLYPIPFVKNLTERLCTFYPLSPLLVRQIVKSLQFSQKELRFKALSTFNWILTKHDYDARYQSSEFRERIASIYFVYLPMLIENYNNLNFWRMNAEKSEKRRMYVGILYLLQNLSTKYLVQWWKCESHERLIYFFDLLIETAQCFSLDIYSKKISQEEKLCTEANIILLDILEIFVRQFRKNLRSSKSISLFNKIIALFVTFLKNRVNNSFLHHLFESLRSFIFKLRTVIFNGNNGYCLDLCKEIFLYCNYHDVKIRSMAIGFFYLLIKINFFEKNNITRINTQATTALSILISESKLQNTKPFENALDVIPNYALQNYSLPDTRYSANNKMTLRQKALFVHQIQGICAKLKSIIQVMDKINKYKKIFSPEKVHEFYLHIANGYIDTHHLRVTWLELLSDTFLQEGNYAEVAMCKLHISAIIAEYLSHQTNLPIDFSIFSKISPTLSEIADDEGVEHSYMYSEKGLIEELKSAIHYFEKEEMHEFSVQLYNLVVPLLEKEQSYLELSHCHKMMASLYDKIVKMKQDNSRVLRYYRVGFYGKKFEEDGIEFIYKEPKYTHLYAFTEKLQNFYTDRFGEPITVFPDSSKVQVSILDPNKCYIQITSVQPISFQKKGNLGSDLLLDQFVFNTPFTKEGTSHGSISNQYSLRTLLTTERPFPYILKRIPVVNRQEFELTPIENSIEIIQTRNQQLLNEINTNPPDLKALQNVLQGSILLQVHGGAIEICKEFLGENSSNYPVHFIVQLIQELNTFLQRCEKALKLNKTLIDSSQLNLQSQLETSFTNIQAEIGKYISQNQQLLDLLSNSVSKRKNDQQGFLRFHYQSSEGTDNSTTNRSRSSSLETVSTQESTDTK